MTATLVDDTFETFVRERQRGLQRSAWLLTGDWAGAEDLTQHVLLEVWRRWPRISELEHRDAYLRRALVNAYISALRRPAAREVPKFAVPDAADPRDRSAHAEQRLVLVTALAKLAPRQRLAVVLRYFQDLTEEQTAAALGCARGTVKSQVSRALRTLRADPALAHLLVEGDRP